MYTGFYAGAWTKAKTAYEEALAKSGFQKSMKFEASPQPKKNRKRNIIWFNPPSAKM